jgi:hypothetical protein
MRLCQYHCVPAASSFELKQNITADAEELSTEMLKCIWSEVGYWLDICHAAKWGYVEI